MGVKVEDFANALAKQLSEYSDSVALEVKAAVDQIANEVVAEIKSHVTFDQPTGKYVKAFRVKTTSEGRFNKTKTWYVAKPYYRLTHLLENGHALRNGGRSKAFVHIKFGEDLAQERMITVMMEAIQRAGH